MKLLDDLSIIYILSLYSFIHSSFLPCDVFFLFSYCPLLFFWFLYSIYCHLFLLQLIIFVSLLNSFDVMLSSTFPIVFILLSISFLHFLISFSLLLVCYYYIICLFSLSSFSFFCLFYCFYSFYF